MSKVRVIFEFDHVMHEVKPAGNDCDEIMEGVAATVTIERDTENRPTGPSDVYAQILKYHSPTIIQFLTDELQGSMQAMGISSSVECRSFQNGPDTLQ
ncbi:hypothetical protein KDF41_004892 [Escherichia coli]|uniref:hypothetical protein n=1 Tax=Escherichia coli TaxID=562 RepID=UPI00295CFCDB|nr:hypothetical protein [Escherichia coli]EIZ7734289.1 hypothetical protein [Escherichia coli]EJN3717150.1 hypothetical protein [Escherichia coli]EJN3871906.1 hypothetical protein [Escherichia coli]EJN4461214.1 hypothetical protein [Escherichia coli]